MRKTFVLDTNILLSSPDAIIGFDDNEVVVTLTTLNELDNKKNAPGEAGYNAREAIRIIERLRDSVNDLVEGINLDNGGFFRVEKNGIKEEYLPAGCSISKADNQIISVCKFLQKKGNEVILVTNDVSMRVIASGILGTENVQDYKNVHVKNDYTGHMDYEIGNEAIDEIYANKHIKFGCEGICENKFVTLHAGNKSALSVFRNGELILIPENLELFGKVKPKNAMQRYAMWALMQPADELPLVILNGPAGTAKTYISLAAGLDKTISGQGYKNDYYKMLISRPNSEAGDNGFGYLPGTLEDKMEPLLAPYYDNLEALLIDGEDPDARMRTKTEIEDLFDTGIIEVCALSYIRGRTLPNSFIICDEAQNAQRQLLKDVITRAGEGSKVIIAGDPSQCDNPSLDKHNNGLVYAIDCWKGSKNAAIITFDDKHSVRSALAKEALERMK